MQNKQHVSTAGAVPAEHQAERQQARQSKTRPNWKAVQAGPRRLPPPIPSPRLPRRAGQSSPGRVRSGQVRLGR